MGSDVTIINIERERGDTKPDKFQVLSRETGLVLDITGYSFTLTIDPSRAPSNADNNLVSISGTIVDAANGLVKFSPSDEDADQTPGDYFYDAELTDTSGDKWTFVKGRYKFNQDISK